MSEKGDKLLAVRMDTRALPLEERLRVMRSMMEEKHTLAPLPSDPPRFAMNGDVWMLDSLSAAADFEVNCRIWREPTDGPTTAIRYRIMREGKLSGIIGEQSVSLEPGDIFISPYNMPYALDMEDFSGRFISMSAPSLGHERASRVGLHILRAGEPETQIIDGAIEGFFKALDGVTIETGNRLAMMLRGTLERHLDSLSETRIELHGRAREWQGPMLEYIEENIANHELGVELLTKAFPTSRAVVYRNFEDFGGVTRYIAKRRLERALSVLVFDRLDMSIGQIATDHGYRSQGHFSRAFKKHFGVSPKDARLSFSASRPHGDDQDELKGSAGLLMRELFNRSGHL